MNDSAPAVLVAPGEDQGLGRSFTVAQIAGAFEVAPERVVNAFRGEFEQSPDAPIDSKQAQRFAEVLLYDEPLDRRQAALMALGAYTSRPDQEWGIGDTPPEMESDLPAARADTLPTELASKRSSDSPATQPSA